MGAVLYGKKAGMALPLPSLLPTQTCAIMLYQQQNALEFSTPPVETSSTHDGDVACLQRFVSPCDESKRMNSRRTRGVSPRNVTHLCGEGVSIIGIEIIAKEDNFLTENCGWQTFPLTLLKLPLTSLRAIRGDKVTYMDAILAKSAWAKENCARVSNRGI